MRKKYKQRFEPGIQLYYVKFENSFYIDFIVYHSKLKSKILLFKFEVIYYNSIESLLTDTEIKVLINLA